MIDGLAHKLREAGVPLSGLSSSQQTYQPEVSVCNARWRIGKGTKVEEIDYATTEGEAYQRSPIRVSRESGKSVRVNLEKDLESVPYPICQKLARAGATDYYLFTLPREYGAFVSFTTDEVGGFTDEHIAIFDAIEDAVGLRLELYTARLSLESLLHLYLGRNAAAHVLSGSFRLGKSEDIEAVIWMCDLRGFTSLTDGAPIAEVLETLNEYFACIVEPVREHGGEVLKFIGDAVLAIFPVAEGNEDDVCRAALRAARQAFASLEAANERRARREQGAFDFGLVLHLGTVSYGNIGTPERLDFTVIGPAVNEAARIEGLCGKLQQSLLVSETFKAHYCGKHLKSLGRHALKGVQEPPEIFTLR
jgi:adenylate cyclase